MRRFVLAGLALLLVPALALAGKTVTEGTNTLKIKAKFDPAKASKSKNKLRPTETKFDYFAGTTDGSRLPELRDLVVYLGGSRFGFKAFLAITRFCLLVGSLGRGPSHNRELGA